MNDLLTEYLELQKEVIEDLDKRVRFLEQESIKNNERLIELVDIVKGLIKTKS